MITFTNGRITFTMDLIFGPCVLSEDGYVPFDGLNVAETLLVMSMLSGNTTCPVAFTDALRAHLGKARASTNPAT
jgi:hypothetical protein